jgi:hypothetical protein
MNNRHNRVEDEEEVLQNLRILAAEVKTEASKQA